MDGHIGHVVFLQLILQFFECTEALPGLASTCLPPPPNFCLPVTSPTSLLNTMASKWHLSPSTPSFFQLGLFCCRPQFSPWNRFTLLYDTSQRLPNLSLFSNSFMLWKTSSAPENSKCSRLMCASASSWAISVFPLIIAAPLREMLHLFSWSNQLVLSPFSLAALLSVPIIANMA